MKVDGSASSSNLRKTGSPGQVRLEMVKTTIAGEVGASTGLFYVPRVVAADPEAGYLELELVPGLRTLRELAQGSDADLMRAVTLLGTGLAEVHARLRLPPDLTVPLPSQWQERHDDMVFVHGDLTMNNVCWDERGGRLVIVDWSAAPALGIPVTFADRCLDLAWFCASAFWEPSWARRPLYPAGGICDRFLTSYASACADFSVERFRRFDHELMLASAFSRSHPSLRSRVVQRLRRARWSYWLRSSRALRALR